jgi:hypothetical protein
MTTMIILYVYLLFCVFNVVIYLYFIERMDERSQSEINGTTLMIYSLFSIFTTVRLVFEYVIPEIKSRLRQRRLIKYLKTEIIKALEAEGVPLANDIKRRS